MTSKQLTRNETMTNEQALEMGAKFRETGKFSTVKAAQRGGDFAEPGAPWSVELWSVNPRSGNRNLTTVNEYRPKLVKALTRKALGRATKRDEETFARLAAERELDRE